ncbi:ATP-binding protein [Termitidicoccus mucosus]|uniref:histidine kinase n=1 Tax=Termitidicoccus mucosus TaxID=1184151 RepID=A0A178IEF7_9BACT|nr:hypothetical protein AW736_18765 [Opitutaceae bacterium TSB47]
MSSSFFPGRFFARPPVACCAAALALVIVAARVFAAGTAVEYSLREWHVSDGLPDEVVHEVVQDSQGYLWVATESGIARFNGLRFDSYSPPERPDEPGFAASPRSSPGAAARGVPAIVHHPEYGLLFAYGNGDIWQWTGAEMRESPVANHFSKGRIASLFVQADGALWANFSDGRLERLRDGRVVEVRLGDAKPPAVNPVTFADDGEDGLWIASRAGLFHFSPETAPDSTAGARAGVITLASATAYSDEGDVCIASSRSGKPWIITRDAAGRWDGRRIINDVPLSRLLGAHYVHELAEDRAGNLWVGTRSQGAYVVKADGSGFQIAPASHRTVRSLCEDNEGNIWLATNGGGLDRLHAKLFRLYDSNAGLDDDLTFTVCEDTQGSVWFANRDGGMARVRNGEVFRAFPKWPKSAAGRVAPDRDGGVWFTAGTGLFKTDVSGETFRRVDPVPFKNIRVMFVSRANELWVGGDAGELGRFGPGGFAVFDAASGFPEGQRPSCIAEDSAGRILVGTNGGNIFRLSQSARPRFESLRAPGSAPLAPVRILLVDEQDTVWVGTGGAGVYVMVAPGGAAPGVGEHHIDKVCGLPDDAVSQMLFDDHGRVWFGSSYGIFSVERREVMDFTAGRTRRIHAAVFGKNEGLEHLSCLNGYQPHCWKRRDGMLWFTTRRGVLEIDPRILRSGGKPPVFIDQVKVNGVVMPPGGASAARPEARIRSDNRRIEFLFSALNFTAPERTPVRYRLDGFDEEWIEAGTARRLVYPRLYPGKYRLRIEAADDEGRWDEAARDGGDGAAAGDPASSASLTLIVVPFWWQTLWFRVALTLVLAAILVAGVRAWSYRRLRRRLERTERAASIDRERTRIARDIHDDLGASLTRISLLSQSAATDAPTAEAQREADRVCFDEIHATTTAITRSINEIVWALDARHDNLESMVSYFDSHAQRFLSLAKIRYRMHAPAQLPDLAVRSRVRHDLLLAFKEALNNAAKYARATEVTVTFEIDSRALALTVADNGRGMPPDGEIAGAGGGGHGLRNLGLRLAAIGGEATVREGNNGGIEVVLTLPLARVAP